MPRGLSLKVGSVLAALAFVVAFRVQAEARESEPTTAPLSPSRASVLESDAQRTAPRAPSVSLVAVADLPRLHREPRAKVIARRKKAAAARRAKARRKAARTAPRTATPPPRSTPAPTPVAPVRPSTPAPPRRSGGGYVGKGFDSEG